MPLAKLEGKGGPERLSVVAGPTCDSIDVIYNDIMLPELECGELVTSPMMGAYTAATATDFNFFPRAKIVVVD
jgi:ornithine decarboxylase